MVKQDRSLGVLILLTIVTCGIYPYIFWYKLAEDMNIICDGDGDHTTSGAAMILLFLFTCGIYPYIWHYGVANRLQANSRRYNLDFPESGTTVLLWMLLGSLIIVGPYIALYIIIKNTNTLATLYNKNNGGYGGMNYNNTPNNAPNNNQNNYNAPANGQNYIADGGQDYNTPPQPDYNTPQPDYNMPPQPDYDAPVQNDFMQTQPFDAGMGAVPSASITCGRGEFSGSSFPVGLNERVVIGREYDCNIRFAANTPKLSRRHCFVEYDGNTLWVTDNNSSYGTYLSTGAKLEPMVRTPLSPGMGFYLGGNDIVFYIQ